MMRTKVKLYLGMGVLLLLAIFLFAGTSGASPISVETSSGGADQLRSIAAAPAAAVVAIDLCATNGTATMPDGSTVTVWTYVETAVCSSGLATSLPGAPLTVNAGDVVTINLTNALGVPTSILIPGQTVTPSGGSAGDFAQEAAASGGTVSYTFTAVAGTYLYESGTNFNKQIPMGLYGALVVNDGASYDAESVLLLSEVDPALNANPAGFNMLDYDPVYWLINGEGYPNTNNIVANAGDSLRLRYLNAGFTNPSMALLGTHQQVIARNGFALPNAYDAVVETIPAGETAEMVVDLTNIAGGTLLPLYDRNGNTINNGIWPGGRLLYIDVQTVVPPTPTDTPVPPTDTPTPVPPTDTPTPVPSSPIQVYFSTAGGGNSNPVPGVAAPYDDADIYTWDGTLFDRLFDARSGGGNFLPGNANINGLTIVSDSNFFVSFNRNAGVNVPGVGIVQDEDIVEYNAGVWSLLFDGTICGLSDSNAEDIDAFDIVGGSIYFSTIGAGSVLGVSGPYDDADIYLWDGVSCSRVFDARSGSGNFLPGNADIDGLTYVDADTFYVSFDRNAGTTVSGLGVVQDESIVFYDAGSWTLYFDGTANGLNLTNGQDLDAIDVP